MKIILSLNHFLPYRIAGIEVYTFSLAKALQDCRIIPLVLVPNFDSDENEEYHHEGIRVIRYGMQGRQNGLDAFLKIMHDEKPDVWHVQELAAGKGIGMAHLHAVKRMGLPVVITMHLSTYSCNTGNLVFKQQTACDGIIRIGACTACSYQALGLTGGKQKMLGLVSGVLHKTGINTTGIPGRLGTALAFPFLIEAKKKQLLTIASACQKIIVLADFYRRMLIANGVQGDKLVHSPQGLAGNAVSTMSFVDLPLRLVFIGRVSKYKGLHLLIVALKNLPPDRIMLDIYGPDAEEVYAADCRRETYGMKNVHWKGSVAPGEVIPILTGYHLLCLPSTFSEMSPLVIQEAFAAGIPVLASNVHGNAEQIRDGVNGWLCEFKNVESLRQKLLMLATTPGLIDAAKQQLPATRSFAAVAREHLELYKNILDEKAGAMAGLS